MRLEQFRRILGFDEASERILEPHWKPALASLPARVEFLEPAFIRENYALLGADPALEPRLLATAARAVDIPAARLYAWLLFHAHFIRFDQGELGTLPPATRLFGEKAGLLHLLVALGTFPLIRRTLDRLGIPQSQLAEMAQWLRGTIDIYAAGHDGRPGHSLQQLYWMRHYIRGELFRIGRFEFLIHTQQEWSPAIYRRRRDGAVLALCRDGWELDREGYRAMKGEAEFTSRLEIRDNRVFGTPISPLGMALLDRVVELSPEEWEPVLTPWEWVPSIHIPGGGGMTPERVLASLREAKRFFREYFHRDIRVFSCASWILNPVWERELPESNLTRFMRMLYLTPGYVSSGRDGLFFVFGRDGEKDWSRYQTDTSLRRAFHRVHASGGTFTNGGSFVLTADLDRLGDGFYRNRAVPEAMRQAERPLS